jgi:hypothetical protein
MKLNTINNGIKAAFAFLLAGTLFGCEPQEFEVPEAEKYAKVFMQSASETASTLEIEMEDKWFEIPLGAGFGGVNLPKSDIRVTFRIDPALIAEYNERNGTSYPAMPEGSYEFTETTVVIPPGSSSSNSVKLKVNPSKFGGIMPHLIAVTIDRVDGAAAVNESMQTTYYLVRGTYSVNPFERKDRAEWTVADFSTDENENASGGRVIHTLDGNPATFWATQWRAAKPGPPHHITIDMGVVQPLHGLYIAGRLTNGAPKSNGNPLDLTVSTSTDGINWTYSQQYTVPNLVENEIWLDYTQNARYFRITVTATHANFYGTHIAEINAF